MRNAKSVRGHVERVPEAESDAYFSSRPLPTQGVVVQSKPAGVHTAGEDQYSQRDKEFDGQTVPGPHIGAVTP